MYGKSIIGGAAVCALAALQSCPAPPAGAIGAIAATTLGVGLGAPLAGNLIYIGLRSGGVGKRAPHGVKMSEDPRVEARQSYPPALPESAEYAYDTCRAQNGDGRTTTVERTAENAFKITGVAPACMTVATFFTQGDAPYPCGNDCLQYDNLSGEGVDNLLSILSQLGAV